MIWATRLISLLALASSLPLSQALQPVQFDVWAPKVLYPHSGTTWYTGQRHNVTWDISSAPKQITNPIGKIYLVSNHIILFQYELTSEFDLQAGRVEVQVPYVDTGAYQVVLIGSSGDNSDSFTIQAQ